MPQEEEQGLLKAMGTSIRGAFGGGSPSSATKKKADPKEVELIEVGKVTLA